MSVARNTAVIASLTLVSRVLGFARDIVLTAWLGRGPVSDAFWLALTFPNTFRRLFAEGAFTQAFVPVYSKRLAEKGPEEADRLAAQALSVLLAASGLVTALSILLMPQINLVLFVGYADDPDTFALATLLTRITMPYLVAMTLATVFAGMLNARGRFVLATAAQSVLNICMLGALSPLVLGLFFPEADWLRGWTQERVALVSAIAVSVAGVAQAGLVLFGLKRSGAHVSLPGPRLTPDVRHLIGLAIPGAIAGGALQINVLVSQSLASFEEGARTVLVVADRLYQLPLGLIGIAVGVAMLPRLSRLVHAGDQEGARGALDEAVALAMAFTLPAAVAFLIAPFWIIDGIFTRVDFTSDAARDTAAALFHYAWGVPAFVLAKIYAPGFFAREDTRAPMRFALVSMALNVVLGAGLFFLLRALSGQGFIGLAIATSLAAWANVGLMISALLRRGAYRPSASALARLVRVGAASLAMGALVALAQTQRTTLEALLGSKEVALLAVVAAGGVAYAVFAFAFRAVTWRELRGAFRRERGAPASGFIPD